jgi:exopolysaccharide production protein ExoQ
LMCFLFGLGLYYISKRISQLRNAKRLFMLGVISIVSLMMINQRFGISSQISKAMGRGEGLTGRTEIWDKILEKDVHSLLGYGFRGFWETKNGMSVAEELHTNRLLSSHNGYLEIYVQGGVIGVFLLFAFLLATGINATDKLVNADPIGRIAIILWPIMLILNVTESAFLQVGTIWFALLIATIRIPWQNGFIEDTAEINEEPVLRSGNSSRDDGTAPSAAFNQN